MLQVERENGNTQEKSSCCISWTFSSPFIQISFRPSRVKNISYRNKAVRYARCHLMSRLFADFATTENQLTKTLNRRELVWYRPILRFTHTHTSFETLKTFFGSNYAKETNKQKNIWRKKKCHCNLYPKRDKNKKTVQHLYAIYFLSFYKEFYFKEFRFYLKSVKCYTKKKQKKKQNKTIRKLRMKHWNPRKKR